LTSTLTAQQTQKVTLDVSETVFSVVTAMNACGYDQELSSSDPVRLQVRAEVARAVENSESARSAQRELCAFYRDHRQSDPSLDLAQYISLALNLGDPPAFTPTVKEADLPPDAAYVLGLVPILQEFYTAVDLHGVWLRHSKQYEGLIDRNSEAVSKMLLSVDVYLKLPISGYMGRRFVVYMEPMAGPGQANARNYGSDYFMVLAPENGQLKLDQVRHTYLHFILDPLVLKHGTSLKRLEPLLDSVKTAPLDENYKTDISLLVTESLIRAVEARLEAGKGKSADMIGQQKALDAAEEGYILAPYFYEKLVEFEKDPAGLQDVFGTWLYYLDVGGERKRAKNIVFKSAATPEVVRASRPKANILDEAEKDLLAGNTDKARELAQQALNSDQVDKTRALFLMARISTMSKDWEGARSYFEKTLEVSKDPRYTAWSHIYLGRIFDLKYARSREQADRDTAVQHYRAALEAGDPAPTTKAAAERGLKKPYTPPTAQQEQNQ
jgi:tetratricopeptide (TPR) repeat protein